MDRFVVRTRDRYPIWVAAALAFATGAVALAGWALDVDAFKAILPGAVQLKANTAIGLCVAGAALAILTADVQKSGALTNLLGGTVALIGLLTLLEYLTGTSLGIDELLFEDEATAFNAIPGRMSPYTAWAFTWLGPGWR
jgi:hypothetical protein